MIITTCIVTLHAKWQLFNKQESVIAHFPMIAMSHIYLLQDTLFCVAAAYGVYYY